MKHLHTFGFMLGFILLVGCSEQGRISGTWEYTLSFDVETEAEFDGNMVLEENDGKISGTIETGQSTNDIIGSVLPDGRVKMRYIVDVDSATLSAVIVAQCTPDFTAFNGSLVLEASSENKEGSMIGTIDATKLQ